LDPGARAGTVVIASTLVPTAGVRAAVAAAGSSVVAGAGVAAGLIALARVAAGLIQLVTGLVGELLRLVHEAVHDEGKVVAVGVSWSEIAGVSEKRSELRG